LGHLEAALGVIFVMFAVKVRRRGRNTPLLRDIRGIRIAERLPVLRLQRGDVNGSTGVVVVDLVVPEAEHRGGD